MKRKLNCDEVDLIEKKLKASDFIIAREFLYSRIKEMGYDNKIDDNFYIDTVIEHLDKYKYITLNTQIDFFYICDLVYIALRVSEQLDIDLSLGISADEIESVYVYLNDGKDFFKCFIKCGDYDDEDELMYYYKKIKKALLIPFYHDPSLNLLELLTSRMEKKVNHLINRVANTSDDENDDRYEQTCDYLDYQLPQLLKMISELKEHVSFQPDGIGYIEAKTHFETLQNK